MTSLLNKLHASTFVRVTCPILTRIARCERLESSTICSQHCVGSLNHVNVWDKRAKLLYSCPLLDENCRHYSSYSYKGNFMAKFSQEIDLDALREQRLKDLKNSGTNYRIHEIVKEILAEKCDEAISNLSAEDQRKLKVIQLEHDFLFSEGFTIPSHEEMTSENWLEALNLTSKQKRLKYYIFWQKKHFRKQSAKNKKVLSTSEVESEVEEKKPVEYNKILLRIYDSAMKRGLNHRLSASMQFGIPLVLDMDYEDHMSNRDMKNTAEQLHDLYCLNRGDEQLPFHLHFTKCPTNNAVYRLLQLHSHDDPHFMATVTPESYMDLFDKDRLVYLSPNGKQVLREFDPNAVYIIGAFNDKATQKPISYARAKEHGIKCMRFPLDQHVKWNIGSKALTLNQVMSIMTAIKNQKSWPEALTAVPSRKIIGGRKM